MVVNITIDIKELIYDIQNKTYLTGRSRSDGKNYRQVALMQANNDDENLNQIMRSISNAFAKIKGEMTEVLEEDSREADNALSALADNRTLVLDMPDNFNTAAVDAISSSIHQYIVASATSEWFMITNKTDTDDYSKVAAVSLELLRESLCKRKKPSRAVTSNQVN
ncbi:MAG: hypothetical protein K2G85_00835 [Muribaculaceae bacterium]|nr:hypothetical protein [Muribaculaceae bacterium]